MPELKPCSKCKLRPQRSPKQRYCSLCHNANQRAHKSTRGRATFRAGYKAALDGRPCNEAFNDWKREQRRERESET